MSRLLFYNPGIRTELALGIKTSPNGSYIFCAKHLYRFDPGTGEISLVMEIPESSNYYVSFSPGNRYLFTLNADFGNTILRYDLISNDLLSSKQIIAVPDSKFPGQMQIGPDGKIYFLDQTHDLANQGGTVGVSVIHCPDAASPSFEQAAFLFESEPGIGLALGLPNFADFLFENWTNAEERSDDIIICEGEEFLLETDFNGHAYLWSTGETSSSIIVSEEDLYSVTISNPCGEALAFHEFLVSFEANDPLFDPPVVITFCDGESIELSGTEGGQNYLWSTGETSQQVSISETGTYEVSSIVDCTPRIQTFEAIKLGIPDVEILFDNSIRPCLGDSLLLSAELEHAVSFLWSNGEKTPVITGAANETYSVTVSNDCEEAEASLKLPAVDCCKAIFPNIFSPNNDGINDTFAPYPLTGDCFFDKFRLLIFDRWGGLISETNDAVNGWDGTSNKKKATKGVYTWKAIYLAGGQEKEATGDVMLIQ